MTKIFYYISPSGDNPVRDFVDALDLPQKKKVLKTFSFIQKYGLSSVHNHTKKLTGSSFWEIKIVGKNSTRVIYAVIVEANILLLNAFLKKSQKIPKNEIEVAENRYQKWLSKNSS